MPSLLAAAVLAIAEVVVAGTRANFEFAILLCALACGVSFFEDLFQNRKQPSSGCAWIVMLLVVGFILIGVATEHRPPSALLGELTR